MATDKTLVINTKYEWQQKKHSYNTKNTNIDGGLSSEQKPSNTMLLPKCFYSINLIWFNLISALVLSDPHTFLFCHLSGAIVSIAV